MPDTTNLLDADGYAVFEYFYKLQLKYDTWDAYTALRDEIVRQAREGMVGQAQADYWRRCYEDTRDNVMAENARLRAELETAKYDVALECVKAWDTDPAELRAVLAKYPAPAVADTGETPECPAARKRLGLDTEEREADKWRITGVVDVDGKLVDVTFSRDLCARIVAMGGGK